MQYKVYNNLNVSDFFCYHFLDQFHCWSQYLYCMVYWQHGMVHHDRSPQEVQTASNNHRPRSPCVPPRSLPLPVIRSYLHSDTLHFCNSNDMSQNLLTFSSSRKLRTIPLDKNGQKRWYFVQNLLLFRMCLPFAIQMSTDDQRTFCC